MLSISSPFTVITFDEEALATVLVVMTKITTLSFLFSVKCIQLLQDGAGT